MKQHINLHAFKYIFVCSILVCCFLIYTFADAYEYSFLTSREYVDGVLGATDATGARIEYACYTSDGEYIVDRTVVPYQNIRFEYDRVKCNVYPSRLPSNTASLMISYPAPCIKNVANYIGYIVIKDFIICTPYDLSSGFVRMYAECVGDDGSEILYHITKFDGVNYTQTDAGNGYYLYTSDPADYQFYLDPDVALFQGIRLEFGSLSSGAFTSLSYGTTYFSFNGLNYIARSGYNAGLEELIRNDTLNTDRIVGSIEDAKDDILDIPDYEFTPPSGEVSEEDLFNTIGDQIGGFLGDLGIDFDTVIDSSTGISFLDPFKLVFVSNAILDPIFNAGVFRPIVTIIFPVILLLVIFGFAGTAGSFFRGDKD